MEVKERPTTPWVGAGSLDVYAPLRQQRTEPRRYKRFRYNFERLRLAQIKDDYADSPHFEKLDIGAIAAIGYSEGRIGAVIARTDPSRSLVATPDQSGSRSLDLSCHRLEQCAKLRGRR
jgi:hypothetical protein